jgi:hypothetical protein
MVKANQAPLDPSKEKNDYLPPIILTHHAQYVLKLELLGLPTL